MWKLAAIMALAASPAAANCADTPSVVEYLATQFGESIQATGLDNDGFAMVVWANRETGTWTVTVSSAEGVTCVISAGSMYEREADGEPV
jgi:hypothetical protein